MVSRDGEVLYEDDEVSIRRGDELSGFRVNECVGIGTFCVVFDSQRQEQSVAIKVAKERYTSWKDIRAVDTEERIVAFLNEHFPQAPIIRQIETFEHEGRRCMVLERANGTLWDFAGVDWQTAKRLLFEIAVGLAVLDDAGVIHADLKPCNVLMVDGRPKLADFNCSKWFESSGRYYGDIGTLRYMAPETLLKGELERTSDVWSYGCIVAAVLWGNDVFPRNTSVDVIGAIVDLLGQPPFDSSVRIEFLELSRDDKNAYGSGYAWSLADLVSTGVVDETDGENVVDLLSKVLTWSPEDRPSAKELLDHPLFAGMHTDIQFSRETVKKCRKEIIKSLHDSWQSDGLWEEPAGSCDWDSVTDASQWGVGWTCNNGWGNDMWSTTENNWIDSPEADCGTFKENETGDFNYSESGWGEGSFVHHKSDSGWGAVDSWGYFCGDFDEHQKQCIESYASEWGIDQTPSNANTWISMEEKKLTSGEIMPSNSARSNEVVESVLVCEGKKQKVPTQECKKNREGKADQSDLKKANILDVFCNFWYGLGK